MDIVWITIGYDRIETCLRRASLRFVLRFNAASAFVSFTHIRVRLRRPGSLCLPAPYVPVMSAHCGCNRFHRGPLIPAPVIFAACGVLGTTSKIAAKRFVTHAADISCDCQPGGHRPTHRASGTGRLTQGLSPFIMQAKPVRKVSWTGDGGSWPQDGLEWVFIRILAGFIELEM